MLPSLRVALLIVPFLISFLTMTLYTASLPSSLVSSSLPIVFPDSSSYVASKTVFLANVASFATDELSSAFIHPSNVYLPDFTGSS